MQSAQIDLSRIDAPYMFEAVQGDTDRQIRILLTDDGEPYDVSDDTVSIWYKSGSTEGNFSDGITKASNELIITLNGNMTKNPGRYAVAALLNRSNGKVSTWNMVLNVQPLPGYGSEAAGEYFEAFQAAELAKEISDLNTRISNIVANAGDTGNNAELVDIRVGYDGTVYQTAGDAVRGQFGSCALKDDLADFTQKADGEKKDTLFIADANGNVICKIDASGVHSVGFDGKDLALNDVMSAYDDEFYIADANGNVIFKADKNGVEGLNLHGENSSNTNISPYTGMKLITIGDSLSAHDKWQKWIVEWLGVTFDNDENINGKDGHSPMAKGGTAISPTSVDSIYMRALDAVYYADNDSGTVIIIYAGQNDSYVGNSNTGEIYSEYLGTIDDAPYTDRAVASVRPTFYSSYMGMIENIIADIPLARLYLMTQMPVRLEVGMEGTDPPYEGVVRFPTEESAQLYEQPRLAKVKAIRKIAEKYNLPVIDLWKDAGINHYNSNIYYGDVGGTCGQVHPNDIGYKRMAEVSVSKMY